MSGFCTEKKARKLHAFCKYWLIFVTLLYVKGITKGVSK